MTRGRLIGGVAVVLIGIALAGAFTAGRLLNPAEDDSGSASPRSSSVVSAAVATNAQPARDEPRSAPESEPEKRTGKPVRVVEFVSDDGNGPVSVKVTTMPAPELPDTPSELSGVFARWDDNSIIVGTGPIELNVEVHQVPGGALETDVSLTANGPEIEVVVTHDTVIYREETEDLGSKRKGGEYTVQQVVKTVDNLDELGKNTEIIVWGSRRGDRVVADILVYRIVNPSF